MHPRNQYNNPPDFKELALKFPEFRKHAKQTLTGKIEVDFTDADAVRALTTALLQKDFELKVDLPPNRLVPTLPLRLNYLLWIEDLLKLSNAEHHKQIHGIDLGTGACCIYPILAAKKFDWHFTATEADEFNYETSVKTLQENNLNCHVKIVKVAQDSFLKGNIDTNIQYDFTMCNPPFFDINNLQPRSRTDRRPEAKCPKSGGSALINEVAVEGGEVDFLCKFIKESEEMKSTVRIFTSMLGRKSSLAAVKAAIKEVGALEFTETEFHQGRTMRWGIAWTFNENIHFSQLSLAQEKINKNNLTPLSYKIPKDGWVGKYDYSVETVLNKIIEKLIEIEVEFKEIMTVRGGRAVGFFARQNTWSHQRRKRREAMKRLSSSLEGAEAEPPNKIPKLEDGNAEPQKTNGEKSSFNLKGDLVVQKIEEEISVLLQWESGGQGRESLNQILQYLKNKLFNSK
nr:EOG090X04JL [Macrothrix elegans]